MVCGFGLNYPTASFAKMDEDMEALISSLGMGEIPIVSEENKQLNELLVSKQIEIAKLRGDVDKENDQVDQLHDHVANVGVSSDTTKSFIQAKKSELGAEKDFDKIVDLNSHRNAKEKKELFFVSEKATEEIQGLVERIQMRDTILDLLEEEFENDKYQLDVWRKQQEEYGTDIMTLLHWKNVDDMEIKEVHLNLEKTKTKADQHKAELDEASTLHKMAQLALDKTAAEYRRLHEERQDVLQRWHESVFLSNSREAELHNLYDKISNLKDSDLLFIFI